LGIFNGIYCHHLKISKDTKEAGMNHYLKITLTAIVCTFLFSPSGWAALSIDSVYPNVGKVGEDLSVTIQGTGFDVNTRVAISLDGWNRSQITGSLDINGWPRDVEIIDQTAYG
jgi:hypothetical protein